MFLILRDVSLTFGFNLDCWDHTFDDGWFHVTQFPTYHIFDVTLGHISFSVESYRSSWSHMITLTYGIHSETMVCLLSFHGLSGEPLSSHSIRPTPFGIRISCFSFWGTPFDLWVRSSYGHGWPRSRIWWWMIWYRLIFWPTTHMMPYWGIFPIRLRFVDLHWFAWSPPVTRCTPGLWLDFILSWLSDGAFLEPFGRAYIF